jgi:hypothetical protein
MGVLNAKQRRASETLPGGRFPMPDRSHAQNALARLNQAKGLSAEDKEKIRNRAHRILGKGHYSTETVAMAKKLRGGDSNG